MDNFNKLRYFAGRRPRIMAHRGASALCPENTLAAFRQALKDGADILEMDVHMSLDGEIVICHDPNVERTTNGAGLISAQTYSSLVKLDAGYKFSSDAALSFPFRGKGIYLPRFEEVLQEFPDTPLNVEIKDRNPALISKIDDLLRRYGRIQDGSVLITAEIHPILKAFRESAGDAISGHSKKELYRFLASAWLGLDFVFAQAPGQALQMPERSFGLNLITASVLKRARELGVELHVWTLNDEAEIKKLCNLGVDGIFTDNPALMRNALRI
ncbi:MAG: glycerophosphodiester phosphodiesterase [Candidatus Obscuribacterales bacterium]|nr:glycerophosphodiester phosphodiesterase [Candidatus Obscuribacterales bacterium]